MGLVLVVHNPASTWSVGSDPVLYDGERVPCPAILAQGIAHGRRDHHYLIDDGRPVAPVTASSKPPYAPPTVAQIRELPWNGLNVVSTFAGAGGSSTGYRMAGYRVLHAVEFVEAAQEGYALNKAAHTYLDPRDVRQVKAEEILERHGLAAGELDVFDGSPPCQAFSTAGRRDKGWGQDREYEGGRIKQRNEELFFEYTRLLAGLKPRAFIAENVAGLARGRAKGMYLKILRELRGCGYRVESRILDAQWLGVPQTRQRLIFVGFREDLDLDPAFPSPLPYRYTVRDALPHIFRVGRAQDFNDFAAGGRDPAKTMVDSNRPNGTILAEGPHMGNGWVEARAVHEQGRQRGDFGDGGVFSHGEVTDQPAPVVMASNPGALGVERRVVAGSFDRFHDKRDVTDEPSPAVLTAQPNHYLVEGDGSDASRRDDHGVERRRFTIDELKAICGFPPDYQLSGTYGQRWERLGDSVPPLMMSRISAAVRDRLREHDGLEPFTGLAD